EIARECCSTVYVDTESDCLWWLHPTPRKEPIDVKFTVEDFFRLHGQSWKSPSIPSTEQQAVARVLAASFESLEPLLEYLKKKSNGLSFTTRLTTQEEKRFMIACEQAGIIARAGSFEPSTVLSVWSMKNREFLKQNAWLEALAYVACKDAGFDDVQWRLKVEGTETDFDVAATRGPLMLVCSCKSGNFKNSHLDELQAQARLIGGSFCKKAVLLMEAVKFSKRADAMSVDRARADLEKRARVLDIRTFYWSDYKDLGPSMKTLMSAARL
ncbi:MAG TPA: hypothetical protein VKC34_15845, partial [Blastocatellia bacterium]|nr:hypothetical protein [Blastocatellia bacterium]